MFIWAHGDILCLPRPEVGTAWQKSIIKEQRVKEGARDKHTPFHVTPSGNHFFLPGPTPSSIFSS